VLRSSGMNPPLIGVSTSVTVASYPERAYVNTAYLRAIQLAGGVPVLLPPQLDGAARLEFRKRLAGVLLTGGGDVCPERFDEAPHPTTSEVSEARDGLEIDFTLWAIEEEVPLLAICRGIQVLNVALGGSLHQDISSELGSPLDHRQVARQGGTRHVPTHHVKVQDGSRLAGILGALEVDVNSFHHQAIKRLGRGLAEVAWAPDSIIEGVELGDPARFVVGVQWHPEELVSADPAARNLFAALVDRARARA
jgi:putative glutamine amidotransferase